MRWWAVMASGLVLGVTPSDGLGSSLVIVGVVLGSVALEARPGLEMLRGWVLGIVWFGLQLAWLPGAWLGMTGGTAEWIFPVVVGLQALVPALGMGLAGALRASHVAPPLALGGGWCLASVLGSLVQPLPGGLEIFAVGLPALVWPVSFGGGPLFHLLVWGAAGLTSLGLRWMALGWGTYAVLGGLWLVVPSGDDVVEIAVLQTEVDAHATRRASFRPERMKRLRRLARAAGDVAWVATPEGAWPEALASGAEPHDVVDGVPILLGVTWEGRPGRNAALLLGGRHSGTVDKKWLVPLAERSFGGFGQDRFQPGSGERTLAIAGRRVGVLICYEDMLPRAWAEAVHSGAEILVSMTNDGWLGRRGSELHLAGSRIAAIATGLPVVRASNTGLSAFIDTRGRAAETTDWVDTQSEPGRTGRVVRGLVEPRRPAWSGVGVGRWLAGALCLVLLAVAGRSR